MGAKRKNKTRSEANCCFYQDRNIFFGQVGQCPHCKSHRKTVDYLQPNVIICWECIQYELNKTSRIRSHRVQEIMDNDLVEINVDTQISTDIKVIPNKPNILVLDKKNKESFIVKVGFINQDRLTIVEVEKLRKYDFLANELGLMHKAKGG